MSSRKSVEKALFGSVGDAKSRGVAGAAGGQKISFEKIMDYPFTFKLFMVANLQHLPFVSWSSDGTAVQIDFETLQNYLLTGNSIFRIKTNKVFIDHLNDYEFEHEMEQIIRNGRLCDVYKHKFFKRDEKPLLCQMVRQTKINVNRAKCSNNTIENRVLDEIKAYENMDPCRQKLYFLTDEQKNKLKLMATVAHTRDKEAIGIAIAQAAVEMKKQKSSPGKKMIEPKFPHGLYVDPEHSKSLISDKHKEVKGFFGAFEYGNAVNVFYEKPPERPKETIGKLMGLDN